MIIVRRIISHRQTQLPTSGGRRRRKTRLDRTQRLISAFSSSNSIEFRSGIEAMTLRDCVTPAFKAARNRIKPYAKCTFHDWRRIPNHRQQAFRRILRNYYSWHRRKRVEENDSSTCFDHDRPQSAETSTNWQFQARILDKLNFHLRNGSGEIFSKIFIIVCDQIIWFAELLTTCVFIALDEIAFKFHV